MIPRFRTICSAFAIAVLFTGVALGDVLHLKTGGRLEGVLISESPTTLTIDVGVGRLSLPRSNVVRIERKQSALSEYRDRLAGVQPGDVEAYAELARFAGRNSLRTEARLMWARVVSLNPRHVEAHIALGHVLVDGQYVDETEAYRARGFVPFEGRWVTPAEQASLLRERELRASNDRLLEEARREARAAEDRARRAEREADRARSDAAANNPYGYGYGSPVIVGSPYWGGYTAGCYGYNCGEVPQIWREPRPAPVPVAPPPPKPRRPSSIW